jgi:hypothetical protein
LVIELFSFRIVPVPFDPKAVFGMVRAPVKVTLNGYTYQSTIASMGGEVCIPLRKSNREAAGIKGGETIDVKIELDTDQREIKPPDDFIRALKDAPPAWDRWQELSFTHQREHVEAIEGTNKPETRAPHRRRDSHDCGATRQEAQVAFIRKRK